MPNYNQKEINKNMEQLFDLPEGSTVQEKSKKILRTEKQSEKSEEPKVEKKKISSRGGKRANAGRPKGSTNKITPTEMLEDFHAKAGMSFHEFINEQIVSAYTAGDRELVSKYLLGFAKYLVQDVQEIKQDITSNGQTLGATFTFPTQELPEWQNDTTTKH